MKLQDYNFVLVELPTLRYSSTPLYVAHNKSKVHLLHFSDLQYSQFFKDKSEYKVIAFPKFCQGWRDVLMKQLVKNSVSHPFVDLFRFEYQIRNMSERREVVDYPRFSASFSKMPVKIDDEELMIIDTPEIITDHNTLATLLSLD